MGGGNAQKTATSRAKHLAKQESEKCSGGGKSAMELRKGAGMAEAMAEAQKKREDVKNKRMEKNGNEKENKI
jgi:hypothetical protein